MTDDNWANASESVLQLSEVTEDSTLSLLHAASGFLITKIMVEATHNPKMSGAEMKALTAQYSEEVWVLFIVPPLEAFNDWIASDLDSVGSPILDRLYDNVIAAVRAQWTGMAAGLAEAIDMWDLTR